MNALSTMTLLASLASTHAFYEFWATPRYDLWYSEPMARQLDQPSTSYTRWTISPDAYELKVRMPDLEPASVRAALAQDGTKIEVIGERKIEGCTCTPSTLKEISLPYRPRAEDIDVAMEKDGVLTLRLERHAKADAPTPLNVKQAADKKEEGTTADDDKAPHSSFRFVPHSSATAAPEQHEGEAGAPSSSTTLAEQEKRLTDKFRAAARVASVAVGGTHNGSDEAATPSTAPATSVKEAAAATAEGTSADHVTADAATSPAANDAAP